MGDLRSYWAEKEEEEYLSSEGYKANKAIEEEWNSLLDEAGMLTLSDLTVNELKELLKFRKYDAKSRGSGFNYDLGYSVKEKLPWLKKLMKDRG